MLPLLLLGFVELTTAFYPFFPGPPPAPYPFPFPLPWGAEQELQRIQNDPTLTKKEYEDQMNQWADKYGVRVKYDAFKKEMEDDKNRSEQELDEALKALPNFFNELRMIENNDTLTEPEAARKKQELLDKLTPKQAEAAQFLEYLFAPDYAKIPGPGPMRPGPFGPGPMRPGPFGPGPLGPAPMMPGPFGPGPFIPFGGFW